MEFLAEYGMFLAKAVTIVVAIVVIISTIADSGQKSKKPGRKGSLELSYLNDHFEEMKESIRSAVLDKSELKSIHKEERKKHKSETKEREKERKAAQKNEVPEEERKTNDKRVYVLNFKGNIAAEAVACLREEISAVLSMASSEDEVLLRLESPGGMVHAYGLASSQLLRLKHAKIPLTVCVDKVAASGGYMMACIADRIVATPFAIIGSIGVIIQLPNFHRVLKKYDVDYEMISAGEYKRTLTTFGENTDKGREKMQEDVDNIHEIFKAWVKEHRPSVEIDKISTGETWVGSQAKERYMVDELKTSDECILQACESADVYEVEYEFRKSIQDKLGRFLEQSIDKAVSKWFEKSDIDTYQ